MIVERIIRTVPLAAAVLLLAGCMTGSFVEKKYVYTRDNPDGYEKQDVPIAFAKAVESKQPVVLFVHGRGDEPHKSLQGMGFIATELLEFEGLAVSKLESHKVKVVMFSWDSRRDPGILNLDFRDRQRPLRNAAGGAERLAEVVRSLSAPGADRPPMVLIAHSMGTIVVETYVRKYGAFPRGIFSSVLLSSADADNIGHEGWVQTLTETSRVYVTVNESDGILLKATDGRDTEKIKSLGLDPGRARAPGATYVRISDTSFGLPKLGAHEAFYRKSWSGFGHVQEFYGTVLRGGAPDLSDARRIGVVDGNLYRLLKLD